MNNKQLAHLWAQRTKTSGKGSSFYFEGPTIFSYGAHFPIAKFYDNPKNETLVLFNCRSYSSTTAKHKCYTRNAIPSGVPCVEVPKVIVDDSHVNRDHAHNVEYLCADIERIKTALKTSQARTGQYYADYQHAGGALVAYCQFFKVRPEKSKAPKRLTPAEDKEIEARIDKYDQKHEDQEAKRAAKEIENLNRWKVDLTYNASFYHAPIALRVNKDVVQTSRGATVPLSEARAAVSALRAGQLCGGGKIGHFTIDAIGAEMVKIGCHDISRAEIERVFNV